MDNKEEFLQICKQNIKRDGADKLISWLETTDFFTCPASTKFHSNVEGGLCLHSLNVYKRLKQLAKLQFGDNYQNVVSDESLAIMGLFHDLCKVNTYKVEYRNVKVDGNWIQQPYFSVQDDLPYGHGAKSVYMLSGLIQLTRDEPVAINSHMSGTDVTATRRRY